MHDRRNCRRAHPDCVLLGYTEIVKYRAASHDPPGLSDQPLYFPFSCFSCLSLSSFSLASLSLTHHRGARTLLSTPDMSEGGVRQTEERTWRSTIHCGRLNCYFFCFCFVLVSRSVRVVTSERAQSRTSRELGRGLNRPMLTAFAC